MRTAKKRWYWVAAVAIVLIGLLAGMLLMTKNHQKSRFLALVPQGNTLQKNVSDSAERLQLSDGTLVTLSPGAALHFPQQFSGGQRVVYLEGSAFFQVRKNPELPFLVYYGQIVTKVLGTSFAINTDSATGNVEVAVKTGRVQVYENRKLLDDKASASVILTRNQKAVYHTDRRSLEAALVANPIADPQQVTQKRSGDTKPFVFDQEKLALSNLPCHH